MLRTNVGCWGPTLDVESYKAGCWKFKLHVDVECQSWFLAAWNTINVNPVCAWHLSHALRDAQNVCALTKVGAVLNSKYFYFQFNNTLFRVNQSWNGRPSGYPYQRTLYLATAWILLNTILTSQTAWFSGPCSLTSELIFRKLRNE